MANPDYTAQDVPTWAANLDSMNSLKAVGNIKNPLLELPLLNSLAFSHGLGSLTFARASIGTYIDRYGVLQSAAIDEPRFEKDGFLVEGASTNKVVRNKEANDVAWTKADLTVTPDDETGSDGATTMDKLVEATTTAQHRILQGVTVTNGANVTVSVEVRADERTKIALVVTVGGVARAVVNFDLATGSILSGPSFSNGAAAIPLNPAQIIPRANGTFRLTLPVNLPSGDTAPQHRIHLLNDAGADNYLGEAGKGLHIIRMQLEELEFASSDIETVASPVTRTADIANLTIAGNLGLQADAGAILADAIMIGNRGATADQVLINVNGESFRRIKLNHSSDGFPRAIWADQNFVLDSVGVTPGQLRRYGMVFDGTNARGWIDGEAPAAALAPSSFDALGSSIELGSASGGYAFAHLRNVRIYDRALSDREMAVA